MYNTDGLQHMRSGRRLFNKHYYYSYVQCSNYKSPYINACQERIWSISECMGNINIKQQ